LQHSDERPAPSGRPSLLSLDQQAEADRHRILSGLDKKPAAAAPSAPKSRKGMVAWMAAGATVLALGAGAGLWLVSEGEKEIVLAGSAPPPSAPVVAVTQPTDAPVVRGTATDVPAVLPKDSPLANIGDPSKGGDASNNIEAGKHAETGKNADVGKKHDPDELSRMLEHGLPGAPTKGSAVPPLVLADGKAESAKAAAARSNKPVHANTKPAKKVAVREEASNVAPRPRVAAAAAAKKKAEAKPAPTAPVDSDVALLAALVAHSKATQPKSSGAAAKLRQCKSLATVAEANQCRAKVCSGAKNEPECKSSSLARAAAEG
jgi:hypothetical protein